jgi:N-acetylmuramoyl-L-alanine amidase
MIAIALTGTFGAQVVQTKGEDTRIRQAPEGDARRICVLPGKIPLWATDKRGQWYRIALCPGVDGWVYEDQVKPTGQREPPAKAGLGPVDTELWEDGERLVMPLTRPAAFRIVPQINPSHLEVDIFDGEADAAATGETTGAYLFSSIKVRQASPGWTRVDVELDSPAVLGYMAWYRDGNELVVDVKSALADGGLPGKVIALDPGHGGRDSGARGPGGVMEKTVNLAVAKRAAELLRAGGAEVVMTREKDRQVGPPGCDQAAELEARLQVAVAADADLFVSIHNNHAGGNSSIGGTEAYYYSAFSKPLAAGLLEAVSYALGSKKRWVEAQPFHVLRSTDCPRALVECLYLSNPAEEQYTCKPEFAKRAAEGIVGGIRQYLQWAAGESGE